MNVLILTPDAVGSTLLQRFITIYMQLHQFDRPVINLHELTNGLERYYSSEFNREIISKRLVSDWGYHQKLKDVVALLSSVDHYKVSRLAQYHLRRRKDPIDEQLPFYKYLDDNFFIIACRRKNVFEYALSWGLNLITKKLNVYSLDEKCDAFIDLFKKPVDIDLAVFARTLEEYKEYLSWSSDHFGIASYFNYEEHVPNIEKYILNLPIFASQPKRITWQETFGIDLKDWNKCHNIQADIGSIILDRKQQLEYTDRPKLEYNKTEFQSQQGSYDIVRHLPDAQQEFLKLHKENYDKGMSAIEQMRRLDILVGPPPIKKQTLKEKRHMIKNFNQCLDYYNNWIMSNPDVGLPIQDQDIEAQNLLEYENFQKVPKLLT